MAKPNEREIRALPVSLEVRGTEDGGKRTIAGHIDYDKDSHTLRDFWGDEFVEVLAPGCFNMSLANRAVVGLWSHDTSQVLGSTKSGTMRVTSNESRLTFELDLPDTQAGNDAWASIRRGDVDGVSFGMRVNKDAWSNADKVFKRTILDAELYEISPVAFAAYPTNEVACRSLENYKTEVKAMSEQTQVQENRTIPTVAIATNQATDTRQAFNHYLRTGEIREDATPLLVSSATKGAALAPVDFSKEIIDGLKDVVVMRQLARILPAISGKSAAYPRRTGGTGASMVVEGAAITPYDLTFDQLTLTPHKAAALVEVSNELLQDEAVDLAGYLSQHFIDEIGELLEGQYWSGDGTGANLQGILTANDGDADAPELLINRVDTASDSAIVADDILTLWAALPAKYRKTATFVCNSAMEAVLRKLKDAEGRYLLVSDLATGLGNTLLGRPLVLAEDFPGTLAAGTDCLMCGDFSRGVYIADTTGIDIQRNDAIGFNKDTVAFRAIFRTDIALAWPDAMRILAVKAAAAG